PRHHRAAYQRGICFYEIEDFEKAEKDFSDFLKAKPRSTEASKSEKIKVLDALTHRGICRLELDKFKEAKNDFSAILEIDPGNSTAHAYLPESLFLQKKYADAGKACEAG